MSPRRARRARSGTRRRLGVLVLLLGVALGLAGEAALREGSPRLLRTDEPRGAVLLPGASGPRLSAAQYRAFDPFAFDDARTDELLARGRAGYAHALYAKSPGGVAATAERVGRFRPLIAERRGAPRPRRERPRGARVPGERRPSRRRGRRRGGRRRARPDRVRHGHDPAGHAGGRAGEPPPHAAHRARTGAGARGAAARPTPPRRAPPRRARAPPALAWTSASTRARRSRGRPATSSSPASGWAATTSR